MLSLPALEALLHRLYVVAPEAALRDEDRKKCEELIRLLPEMARVAPKAGLLVDAAAGKGTLGLLALHTVLSGWKLVALERDPHRVTLLGEAALRAGLDVDLRATDVGERSAWPEEPSMVVALHACGAATDAVIERATAVRAHHILLVPCCYGGGSVHHGVPAVEPTLPAWADLLGFPSHGAVRGTLARALTDARRTLMLEAQGYETTVTDLIPAHVTPFGRLFRARRMGEPVRMERARRDLDRLRSGPTSAA